MIERIGERTCNMPWHQIHCAPDTLQITKIFNLNQRVHMRDEISSQVRNILNKLNIKIPKQLIYLEITPQKQPLFVDTR